MNQSGRSFRYGWLVVGALALAGALGCSDEDGKDGNQGGSSGAGGTSADPLAPDEVPSCRASEPTDVGATFTLLAGDHTFTLDDDCVVDGVSFAAGAGHHVVANADAQRIDVIPAGSSAGLSYSWDGAKDLACKGEYTQYLEVDGHGRYVRLGALNRKPTTLVFGLCIGDLSE